MTVDDNIKDEKLQYDIDKEAAKISALSSARVEKYEYLTVEETLPSNQKQIVEQAKFTYSPLGKALAKQTEKQVDALKSLKRSYKTYELERIESIFPKHLLNDLIIVKFKEIIKFQDIFKTDELYFKSSLKILVIFVNIF